MSLALCPRGSCRVEDLAAGAQHGTPASAHDQFRHLLRLRRQFDLLRHRYASALNRMLAYDWRYTLAEADLPKVWVMGTGSMGTGSGLKSEGLHI